MKLLYLTQNPDLVQAQLSGRVINRVQAGALRDDVSTDEITPVAILSHYDQRLGDFAHTGLVCSGVQPIARGRLRASGVDVLVAGQRYGKGSSREHSPTAERWAGIRLVFAASFERIYRQNADNIGLWTSTNFALLERLEDGEVQRWEDLIPDLLREREGLAASVLQAGGLLQWGQRHLQACEPYMHESTGPQTLFEKILSRHLLHTAGTTHPPRVGEGLFVQADWRFIHEYYTGMADSLMQAALDKGLKALGDELRTIEAGDVLGDKFPRFKKSDDATALLLRVT